MTLTAINNSQPRGERAWVITEPVHVALVRLLEGNGEPDDVLKIGLALNLTTTRLKCIIGAAQGKTLMQQAGLVLMQAEDVASLADFTPEAKQLVIEAVDLYEETMRKSSPIQMEQAQRELQKAMGMAPRGKVRRA